MPECAKEQKGTTKSKRKYSNVMFAVPNENGNNIYE